MAAQLVFLNSSGTPASASDRTLNCIAITSPVQAESIVTLTVRVKNVGTSASGLVSVEFFLQTPLHGAQPLPTNLCNPHANPVAPATLQPGDIVPFSVEYAVQDADAGASVFFAQIQPPGDPGNLDTGLDCNALKRVIIRKASLMIVAEHR